MSSEVTLLRRNFYQAVLSALIGASDVEQPLLGIDGTFRWPTANSGSGGRAL